MGIRIALYAVNAAVLEQIARQTLGTLLCLYRDMAVCDEESLVFYDLARPKSWYFSSPKHGVCHFHENQISHLCNSAIAEDAFLNLRLMEHLARSGPTTLRDILDRFIECPETDWVTVLTTGMPRWWIGSFLRHAQTVLGHTSQSYVRLARLFHRMVAGYDCGVDLPVEPLPLRPDFPIPLSDTSHLCIWSSEEISFVCQMIHILLMDTSAFSPYAHSGGIPAGYSETARIYTNLSRLLMLEHLPISNLRLFSVIGG